ncbi:hypothetical protein FQN54_000204 [Arachnomyces sp. PD_36]|nr:hypothetical protein FQN54_000204 [Arachnomyces sp. PD_36]
MQTTQHTPAHVPGSFAPTSTYSSSPPQNYTQQTPNASSPHSRRSNRQQGGNGAPASSPMSSQQFYSPNSTNPSSMNTPRQQPLPPSTQASPITPQMAQNSRAENPPRATFPDSLGGGPPIPPPRTSSNQRSRNDSSRERITSPHNSRRRTDNGDRDREANSASNHRDRSQDDRSRRRAQQSPEIPQRTASTREPRDQNIASTIQSRSDAPTESHGLSKEDSAVLNRMVVTDPEVDIERERERQAEARPSSGGNDITPITGLGLVGSEGVDDGGRGGTKSRHDYSNTPKRRETSFGQYVLGQTLGEGEFGKVKLGWKKDGSVQVAIKLIRRESLGSNPTRIPKIYREISILRELSHPNIVRLHEMVETDRTIGIILEYASGGELFDYILNHHYLKDNAARRLFAQLVSGVGYLHKKGIVHRDLKLENLLLDRNRNIIITDFGFANMFNPADELGEEIEYNLTNREFVKRMRLDRADANGMKRGDLMQTSCGSPCYAAPELVVSDSLYTGRKVDVWSCGVILYAMLAGYLPFDDDPANPDGDNINLLYKYIVSTPLTFPEYVTPHARDLLRRILVADPRKRADLFEVARHSWLSEFAHVVSHITSSTTNVSDIANSTVPAEDQREAPSLARSASVREPPKTQQQPPVSPAVGGLSHQQGKIAQDETSDKGKTPKDAKRRTVQVEYVPPQSQTTRGESASVSASSPSASRARGISASRAPVDTSPVATGHSSRSKPLPQDPPVSQGTQSPSARYQGSGQPSRDVPRTVSESTRAFGATHGPTSHPTRPTTGGSPASGSGGKPDVRLPSRGSYGQPVAPTVATTNAQGRLAQPKNGKSYVISGPFPQSGHGSSASIGQPTSQPHPAQFNATPAQEPPQKGHKRSNTVSGISEKLFGRSGSMFGGRSSQPPPPRARAGKRYPPTSMKDPYGGDNSRTSIDSRRSIAQSFTRKQSDGTQETRPRRFSLLPASFSLKSFTGNKEPQYDDQQPQMSRYASRENSTRGQDGPSDYVETEPTAQQFNTMDYSTQIDQQFATLQNPQGNVYQQDPYSGETSQHYNQNSSLQPGDGQHQYSNLNTPTYSEGHNGHHDNGSRQSIQTGRSARGSVLQKNNRRFADAYDYEKDPSHHSGSSGAARKVMDFFRRRGKARGGDYR